MRSSRARLALLAIDLDGFKTVHDSLGRPTGDELLPHHPPPIEARSGRVVGAEALVRSAVNGSGRQHPIMREGMALFLNNQPDLHLGHQAASIAGALAIAASHALDLAIVDISLSKDSGLDLIKT